MPKLDERWQALQCLLQVIQHGRSLNEILLSTTPPLARELCYGVLRHYYLLQEQQQHFLKKPLKSKDTDIGIVILLGLYQQQFARIPAHAILFETVALCPRLNKAWARGLVNAVLRRAQRETHPPAQSLQANFNHEQWFIEQLRKDYPEDWQSILTANNQHPPMILRVNQQRINRHAYLNLLTEHSIAAHALDACNTAIRLEQAMPVSSLPGFAQGLVSVQDLHAQMCVDFLQPKPHQRLLDACAAPGGKSCHLLEIEPQLELWALDKYAKRLERLQDNLKRLHLHANVSVACCEALDSWWDGHPFDSILLDAPCSGSGVIRRHPDIKLRRQAPDIAELQTQQCHLLMSLWPTLARGGQLLYVTCSVLPAENSDVIAHCLKRLPDAKETKLTAASALPPTHGLQYLPGIGDGFYYCLLTKAC